MKSLFKKILLIASIPELVTIPCFSVSCTSNDSSSIRRIDGTDWEGLEAGNFCEDDYVIDDTNKTVTYISSFGIHTHDLIIPNYVMFNNEQYRVLLGKDCFANNSGITGSVEMNDFINVIPDKCFYSCQSLQSVYFHIPPEEIGNFAFSMCTLLSKIAILQDKTFQLDWLCNVKSIGVAAFYHCYILTGDLIFNRCLSKLGERAFDQCRLIGDIDFQFTNKIESIPNECFAGCGCTKVKIPSSIKRIDDFAFMNCFHLSWIDVVDENTELSLGDGAFFSCEKLYNSSKPIKITSIGNKCFNGDVLLHITPWNSENSLDVIPYEAFASCDYSSLYFDPDGAQEIKDYAFSSNSNLCYINFEKFKNGEMPKWTGYNIFANASSTGGTIVLSQGANLNEWKAKLEFWGIPINQTEETEAKWYIEVR